MSARHNKKEDRDLKLSTMIIVSLVLMTTALIYVWSHVHFTKLNYLIAEEMGIRDSLLEENRKLKVEYATLKSPQNIEAIARAKLNMYYPEREQVIFLK
ncbi:MAG: cell division protein FtsL [Proteobacteria bacterium]|nr:cell division protein FtsL [Pseudomonadota bacterium]